MNGLFLKQQLVTGGLKCAKQASKEDVVVFGKTSIKLVAENQDSHLYPPVIEMKPYQNVGIFEPYQRRWERLPDFWLPSFRPRIIGSNLWFGTMRIARKATSLAPLLRYEATSTPLKCQMLELGRVNHRIRSTKNVFKQKNL